ncbi:MULTISPECIES: DUF2971 domain-containing protein [Vibrio]|uniref:DUF2971 domain-containing protein n=1 Tax=Vibrio TaxID=662 RepID=UPI00215F209E|nr:MULTISPECIES: DUF2971 domain-containing protein [Vibrio]MCS0234965.1 DUF2971 domain-containing protein [Vibrio alginolyticus]MCS0273028.1 DUF2971 domain-containing protein [Vibrio alginolyticus]MDW1664585.1 DUF2971 domain-containing protein [Vibrio sp. Vb2656]MDW1701923.1 DUF2971 domain-containing protein [Vibrio sp. Vb2657]
MVLYKYRDFNSLRFLFDIFLNNRLYAAKYTNLNDPMEGHYLLKPEVLISDATRKLIKNTKDSYGIVSLCADEDNPLMWAHYANGHNGIAIGVEVIEEDCELAEIKYRGLSELSHFAEEQPELVAQKILTYKHDFWGYENEYRVLTRFNDYVSVEVVKVIFGCKVSDKDFEFYNSLISRLNPNIEIERKFT